MVLEKDAIVVHAFLFHPYEKFHILKESSDAQIVWG